MADALLVRIVRDAIGGSKMCQGGISVLFLMPILVVASVRGKRTRPTAGPACSPRTSFPRIHPEDAAAHAPLPALRRTSAGRTTQSHGRS